MERQSFLLLTTSSQWLLFLGIALLIYSWIEPKKITRLAGQLIFILLGFFAVWVLLSGQISIPETITEGTISPEARAISFFKGLVVTGSLGIIGLFIPKRNTIWGKIPNLIIIPIALILFFMVYNLQRL